MSKLMWIFVLTYLLTVVRSEPQYEVESNLRHTLFTDYNKNVPPRDGIKDNITVNIGITLLGIDELDLSKEVLTTHIWFKMRWTDIRLKWDPSKYNGQDHISVPIGYLWKPDIEIHNNAGRFSPTSDYMAMLFSNGDIGYLPHVSLTTSCPVDLRQFPFDEQTCQLKFGSWTYASDTLLPVTGTLEVTLYEGDNTWLLTNYSHEVITEKYPCCVETYSVYVVNLTLRRRTGLLMNMYTAPAVCISLLLPAVFLLPAGSTFKLILASAALISQLLMLESLVEVVPLNHLTIPKLAVYYLINIVLISLSLVLSSVIICLWQRSRESSAYLPRLVDKIFLGALGRLLCVSRERYMSDNEGEDVHKGQVISEWRQLAAVLDRLFLIIFLVIALFTTIALLSTAKQA